MIEINISNSNPSTYIKGQTVKLSAPIVTTPDPPIAGDFCSCKIECEYYEKAFHYTDDSEYRNDKSSFLFAKQKASDSILIELFKNDVKVADLNNDDNGVFYDGFTEKPLYVGYLLNWRNVYENHGNGLFQVKANSDILGVETVYKSRKFILSLFSDLNANGTVKVESFQTGNIVGSQFDYTDLLDNGWYESYRIKGFFGDKTPALEQDNYLDANYKALQIQDKNNPDYILRSKYMPAEVANNLFYENTLANTILISDYNVLNHELYNQLSVIPSEFTTSNNNKTMVRQEWKFKDRVQNNIKRNF